MPHSHNYQRNCNYIQVKKQAILLRQVFLLKYTYIRTHVPEGLTTAHKMLKHVTILTYVQNMVSDVARSHSYYILLLQR